MPSNYTVIDLETSIFNRGPEAIGKNKADPFYAKNRIEYTGMKESNQTRVSLHVGERKIPDTQLLVGQNIKFDLHYLMRDPYNRGKLKTLHIWDTQLAEYILTGQQSKMISLDRLATKYGGTVKDDKIKEYWNNDVDTHDIPVQEILDYLEEDVKNTELVFRAQIQKAKELGMLELIQTQMEALLATTEMEFNGMHFNVSTALVELSELIQQKRILERRIIDTMYQAIPKEHFVANPESKDHLSAVLFGGNLKYTATESVLDDDGKPVTYKSGKRAGQIKTRKAQMTAKIPGMVPQTLGTRTSKDGVYKTDEEVLKNIVNTTNSALKEHAFCSDLLVYRGLCKEIGTYYSPYINFVHDDGCIHGKLLHTNTGTGRLSSQAPNLQNMTNED